MKRNLSRLIKTTLKRHVQIMTLAMTLDALFGDPEFLYQKLPHPVVWIGKGIDFLELKLNRPNLPPRTQKRNGFYTLLLITCLSGLIGTCIQKTLFRLFPSTLATFLTGILSSIFIAQRSLHQHVMAVKTELDQQNLPQARHAVSQIVGRETQDLDSSSVCRAAIESLAENFSDGVTAPVFWGCIGGLPGILIYKTINTADSMIGHLTKRYRFFGYAAAKSDDYANYLPARLSALYLLLTQNKDFLKNSRSIHKDAKKHNSPNAGWPEASMAYCLGIQLAGPRHYKGYKITIPFIGKGRHHLYPDDIQQACRLFHMACFMEYSSIILLLI